MVKESRHKCSWLGSAGGGGAAGLESGRAIGVPTHHHGVFRLIEPDLGSVWWQLPPHQAGRQRARNSVHGAPARLDYY